MPDRNECVKCGVELPFYLGFGEDLCPRCKGEVREMEEACVLRDRAEAAEAEVNMLESSRR